MPGKENPDILVVGSINTDMMVRTKRMPAPGETISGKNFQCSGGGKGANQAIAASRLGGNVTMIGRVGDDHLGTVRLEELAAEKINIDNVMITDQTPSGIGMIIVDSRGENTIVVAGGANLMVTPDDIYGAEECFRKTDFLLLQMEIPTPAIRAAKDLANRHNCRIVLDPSPANQFPEELYKVETITPNLSEAQSLSGKNSHEEERMDKIMASELIDRGAKQVVLKLGSRGSLVICNDGHMYRLKPFNIDPVDSTGAGDTFTAALTVALGRGSSIHEAAIFANAAGALACTKYGAQASMPDFMEVEILIRDQS